MWEHDFASCTVRSKQGKRTKQAVVLHLHLWDDEIQKDYIEWACSMGTENFSQKIKVFWDVTLYRTSSSRRFEGLESLHLHGQAVKVKWPRLLDSEDKCIMIHRNVDKSTA
jgi:hypothetical protein